MEGLTIDTLQVSIVILGVCGGGSVGDMEDGREREWGVMCEIRLFLD